MSELTYDDFKQRLTIQDLLLDAGYHLNRRDGLRYPSYVRLDADGRRIRGDKFIVTGNNTCCFQPPTYKNYNIISFIKEHPDFFAEYKPGMSPDRLVNLVCNRLLNQPVSEMKDKILEPEKIPKPFILSNYSLHRFMNNDFDSQKKFFPFFKQRGINLFTQHFFQEHFMLATKNLTNGKSYTNLAFPLHIPGKDSIVGFEERGIPNREGKSYKGMAEGSNASQGLWIANLSGKPLSDAGKVYWFESAYDAMAYFQLKTSRREQVDGVYVSTGGNPSESQFKGILKTIPNAEHHLCFDHDDAGKMFSANFALVANGERPNAHAFALNTTETNEGNILSAVKNYLKGTENAVLIPSSMNDYINSLRDRKDVFSGEPILLPDNLLNLFIRYEKLEEEYHSVAYPKQLCDEDLEDLKKEAIQAAKKYTQEMKKAFGDFSGTVILRELPESNYKDWNEQLIGNLHKSEQNEEDIGRSHYHR